MSLVEMKAVMAAAYIKCQSPLPPVSWELAAQTGVSRGGSGQHRPPRSVMAGSGISPRAPLSLSGLKTVLALRVQA